jgi:hypothetical protein
MDLYLELRLKILDRFSLDQLCSLLDLQRTRPQDAALVIKEDRDLLMLGPHGLPDLVCGQLLQLAGLRCDILRTDPVGDICTAIGIDRPTNWMGLHAKLLDRRTIAEEQARAASVVSQATAEANSAAPRQSSTDSLMLDIISKNGGLADDLLEWSAARWAKEIGRSKSAVIASKVWANIQATREGSRSERRPVS